MVDTVNQVKIPTLLKVSDVAYNDMRIKFKDITEYVIRPSFNYPSKPALAGTTQPKMLGSADPHTMIKSEHRYNPALERRLIYKNMMC